MLYAHANYPVLPLPPVAAVLLEGFQANERCRENDREGGVEIGDLEYQRNCALYSGARDSALTRGGKNSHADQAAALLVMIDELDQLLDGSLSIGSELDLDDDEVGAIRRVRDAAVSLLRWHFDNGAGALRPIAVDLGLIK